MTQPTPVLARRIGPVPIWLIVLLIGGLAFWLWWRKRNATGDGSSVLPGGYGGVITSGDGQIYTSGGNYSGGAVTTPSQTSTGDSPGAGSDTPPGNTPTPAPATTTMTYTVKSGDTLERIASQFKTTWANIAYPNEQTLDAVARQHGLQSSHGGPNNSLGWWIFPGEVLQVPS